MISSADLVAKLYTKTPGDVVKLLVLREKQKMVVTVSLQALSELAEVQLSPKQVRRLVKEVGEARVAERDAAVEQLKSMTLPARRLGSQACMPPAGT